LLAVHDELCIGKELKLGAAPDVHPRGLHVTDRLPRIIQQRASRHWPGPYSIRQHRNHLGRARPCRRLVLVQVWTLELGVVEVEDEAAASKRRLVVESSDHVEFTTTLLVAGVEDYPPAGGPPET
jgi:hypothetical protein